VRKVRAIIVSTLMRELGAKCFDLYAQNKCNIFVRVGITESAEGPADSRSVHCNKFSDLIAWLWLIKLGHHTTPYMYIQPLLHIRQFLLSAVAVVRSLYW